MAVWIGTGEQRWNLCLTTNPDLLWSKYVAPDQTASGDPNLYLGPILPVYGAYHFCAWKADVEARQAMLAPASFGPPEKAYGNVQVSHPGCVLRASGEGRTAMVPWTIGRAYRDLGLTAARDVIHQLASELLGEDEQVSAELAEQIEGTLHRTGRRIVIHLVNMSGARRTNFGPPVRVRDGVLHVRSVGPGATRWYQIWHRTKQRSSIRFRVR